MDSLAPYASHWYRRHRPQHSRGGLCAARHDEQGYTLIEVLVAVAVAGVLSATGLPSLRGLMLQRAVQGQAQEFRNAVQLARREAMTRGEVVSLCARHPADTDQGLRCAVSGKDWSNGWLIFVDRQGHGDMGAGDLLLRVHQPSGGYGPVVATLRSLSFQHTGISLNSASHFRFLPPGASHLDVDQPGALLICVNKPGRARLAEGGVCEA
jgi:type IV fimbrial biogenesis protein FimT